jgi:hypothetical protein
MMLIQLPQLFQPIHPEHVFVDVLLYRNGRVNVLGVKAPTKVKHRSELDDDESRTRNRNLEAATLVHQQDKEGAAEVVRSVLLLDRFFPAVSEGESC